MHKASQQSSGLPKITVFFLQTALIMLGNLQQAISWLSFINFGEFAVVVGMISTLFFQPHKMCETGFVRFALTRVFGSQSSGPTCVTPITPYQQASWLLYSSFLILGCLLRSWRWVVSPRSSSWRS